MNKTQSLIPIVSGLILIIFNHVGISSGQVTVYLLRYSDTKVSETDPTFWQLAGGSYGLALFLLFWGTIYFTTGYRYLPEICKSTYSGHSEGILLFAGMIGFCGFLAPHFLPNLYI